MSVPVVGFSFKPKGLVLVTPLFHQSGYGGGAVFFYTRAGEEQTSTDTYFLRLVVNPNTTPALI